MLMAQYPSFAAACLEAIFANGACTDLRAFAITLFVVFPLALTFSLPIMLIRWVPRYARWGGQVKLCTTIRQGYIACYRCGRHRTRDRIYIPKEDAKEDALSTGPVDSRGISDASFTRDQIIPVQGAASEVDIEMEIEMSNLALMDEGCVAGMEGVGHDAISVQVEVGGRGKQGMDPEEEEEKTQRNRLLTCDKEKDRWTNKKTQSCIAASKLQDHKSSRCMIQFGHRMRAGGFVNGYGPLFEDYRGPFYTFGVLSFVLSGSIGLCLAAFDDSDFVAQAMMILGLVTAVFLVPIFLCATVKVSAVYVVDNVMTITIATATLWAAIIHRSAVQDKVATEGGREGGREDMTIFTNTTTNATTNTTTSSPEYRLERMTRTTLRNIDQVMCYAALVSARCVFCFLGKLLVGS